MLSSHRSIIQSNIQYKNVIECIQSGVLQHVVSIDTQGNLISKINKHNQRIIHIFNELCLRVSLYSIPHPFHVYRALYNIPDTIDVLQHPIPFSTTLSLSFAQDWLYGYNKGRVILSFPVTKQPYVYVNNNIEQEVLFPAGKIVCHTLYCTYKNTRYYLCDFIPDL